MEVMWPPVTGPRPRASSLVVGMSAVHKPPLDRLDARTALPKIGMGEEQFPADLEHGVAQQRIGQHAIGDEAVDHRGACVSGNGEQVSGHGLARPRAFGCA
jgi:hypothetical protein